MQTRTPLIDIDVSWLNSWIAWRNIYTEPLKTPFNLFDESYLDQTDEGCPLCKDMLVVNDENHGVIYCMCQLSAWEQRIKEKYDHIRTLEQPATLQELDYHPALGDEGIATLKKTVVKAEAFIKSPTKWLLISGPYGVGKTHIMRAINEQLSPIALYISAADVEDLIHKYRKNDELGDLYDLLRLAPILLIDDLGIEYGGNLFKTVIDRVIDGRIKRFPDKPTVITTNMAAQDIPGYIERTGDRLMNLAQVERAYIAANSYRKIKPNIR